MRKGLLSGLESDILEQEVIAPEVIDGDSVLEEIAVGNEDILPDEYTELDGGMTTVENISDAIENEETIMEEVETPLLEEGTESDFNKTTLRLLAASHMRLNNLLGVDENRGAPVAALESNIHGGYKAAFAAGLEAKEGFLKNLKTKAAAGFKAMLDAIKKFIQKAIIFFNGVEKSATKLETAIKAKGELKDKADKLTEDDKKSLANKFGAWVAMGGEISGYVKYAKSLEKEAVPAAGKKVPLRDGGISTMPAAISKDLALEGRDEWSILNLTGKTAKFLVLYTNYKASTREEKPEFGDKKSKLGFALDASEFADIAVKAVNVTVTDKDIKDTNIPTTSELLKFATTARELAKNLKATADKNYSAAESFSKAIKDLKDDEAAKGAALEMVSKIATRAALENVSAYMSAMKTILWYSSTFAKRYAESAK